jgi:hypothetical protein
MELTDAAKEHLKTWIRAIHLQNIKQTVSEIHMEPIRVKDKNGEEFDIIFEYEPDMNIDFLKFLDENNEIIKEIRVPIKNIHVDIDFSKLEEL